MAFYYILPLVSGMVNLLIGLLVIYRGHRSKINILFSLTVISMSLWSFSTSFELNARTEQQALFMSRLSDLWGVLSLAFLLHFLLAFSGSGFIKRRYALPLIYAVPVVFILLIPFTGIAGNGVAMEEFGFMDAGQSWLFYPFALYCTAYAGLGLAACGKLYMNAGSKTEKAHARSVLIAVSVPLVMSILTDVILNALGFRFIALTPVFIMFVGLSAAYAMNRHKLLASSTPGMRKKLIVSMLFPILLISMLFVYFTLIVTRDVIENEMGEHMNSIAESKSGLIDLYFSERGKGVEGFLTSSLVMRDLNEQAVSQANTIRNDVKGRVEAVASQIDGYIKSHPDMTVDDLQKDPDFQNIAVQPVGKNGYTAVLDYEKMVNRFHKNPGLVDVDLHTLAGDFPEFWSVISKVEGGHPSSGFYYWREADGTIKEKYMENAIIPTRTADGAGLSVAATVYTEDYNAGFRAVGDTERLFNKFVENYGYWEMFLFDQDGRLLWSYTKSISDGSVVSGEPLNGSLAEDVFRETMETRKMKIYDYGVSKFTGKPVLLLSAPVFTEDRLSGIIILEMNADEINALTSEMPFGEAGEVYTVGNDYLARSELKFYDGEAILSKRIETEGTRKCVEDLNDYGNEEGVEKHNESYLIYADYSGREVMGVHSYSQIMRWCIITEVDTWDLFSEMYSGTFIISAAFFFVSIFSVASVVYFSRKFTGPVIEMAEAAKRVEKGDFSMKLGRASDDEIGSLVSSFNSMVGEIEKSRKTIERHSYELEGRVAERTKDLGKKIKESEESKTAILNMMEDVDAANRELVEAQEKLKKSVEDLRQLDVKKDEFLSIAAHEFKTPLTAIHGFAELLQEDKVIRNRGQREKYLKIMMEETHRLASLVTEILDLSRIDLGTFKISMERFGLDEFLNSVKEEMSDQIKRKGLSASYVMGKGLPESIYTDRERLKEIMINLLSNAMKYTPKGEITVRVEKEGNFIRFSVTDTGIGIPKEKETNIFQRFYQIDSVYTRESKGTGLGLSICKEYVRLLGGRIGFQSVFGKGSVFWFTIPAGKGGSASLGTENVKEPKEPGHDF